MLTKVKSPHEIAYLIATYIGNSIKNKQEVLEENDLSKKLFKVLEMLKGEIEIGKYEGYDVLLYAIIECFRTGKVPVTAEETIELYAFMEAADESKRRNGAEVKLSETINMMRGAQRPHALTTAVACTMMEKVGRPALGRSCCNAAQRLQRVAT